MLGDPIPTAVGDGERMIKEDLQRITGPAMTAVSAMQQRLAGMLERG